MVFSNTHAAIAGAISLIELIVIGTYMVVNIIRFRREIIEKGRLIPTILGVSSPYGPPTNQPYPGQFQQYPPLNQQYQNNYSPQFQYSVPPQPGAPSVIQHNTPYYIEIKEKM